MTRPRPSNSSDGSTPSAPSASGLPAETSAVRTAGEEIMFSPKALAELHRRKNWSELARSLLILLHHFGTHPRMRLDAEQQEFLDSLAGVVLHYLSQHDFDVPGEYAVALIRMQPEIANLTAISRLRTTDDAVRALLSRPDGLATAGRLAKLLALYNPRCRLRIERKSLFDVHPTYASIWYAMYCLACESFADETVWRNMREHVAQLDDRYVLFGEEAAAPYFMPTYVDFGSEPHVRGTINRLIRRHQKGLTVRNTPREGSLAVITSRWNTTSSVYRSIRPYVAALAEVYDLTLVLLGAGSDGAIADADLFGRVRHVDLRDHQLVLDEIAENDFQAAWFVDVGLYRESIYLSNVRLAPVQFTGYGHPVSTFGGEIDYYIGGADIEDPARASERYSERLVLIPGIGLAPVWQDYQPRPPRSHPDPVVVNCPWTPPKINHPLLASLAEIARQCRRKVLYRFYATYTPERMNAYLPFCRDLVAALGAEHVRIEGPCDLPTYLQRVSESDLTLTSWPFGGYNIVLDSLAMGRPVVARQGDRFCNVAAATLIQQAGPGELVADSEEEFVAKTVHLIDDESYRIGLWPRVAAGEMKRLLFDSARAGAFVRAVAAILASHQAPSSSPSPDRIVIS